MDKIIILNYIKLYIEKEYYIQILKQTLFILIQQIQEK